MGKKQEEQAKKEAKKLRQANKLTKATAKRVKKETGEDITNVIAEFSQKDHERTSVIITLCTQPPTPRANFSMITLSNGDLLLFGGEYNDGAQVIVYNEMYRWNIEKNEWKLIESVNTPPPRCSHQTVLYKDKLYLYGGEYATLDSFYHYKDLWELDLKTNIWTEIQPIGDLPSARSGHRMIVWKSYIILFGGFYEALRDVKWFNDLYFYNITEQKWTLVIYKPLSILPRPRSGFQMTLHTSEDTLFIYGGYSKVKDAHSKMEGRCHEDMWCLNLKNMLINSGSSSVGGKAIIDPNKANWQKVTKKGIVPSKRCSAVMTIYKNKAILFGGVYDEERERHTMLSTFYNDLYAFDMERKRWYQLGIRTPKTSTLTSAEMKKNKKLVKLNEMKVEEGDTNGVDVGDYLSEDDEDGEIENDIQDNDNYNNDNDEELFGYIDESGNVVYVRDDEPDTTVSTEITSSDIVTGGHNNNNKSTLPTITTAPHSTMTNASTLVAANIRTSTVNSNDSSAVKLSMEEQLEDALAAAFDEKVSVLAYTPQQQPQSQTIQEEIAQIQKVSTSNESPSKYFSSTAPCPRINPCLMVRGNTLYIYGGIVEVGDIEVTLDDCWSLDLNKRDSWRQVLPGTMHTLIWRGEVDDATEGTGEMSDEDDEDDSDIDHSSEDDENDADENITMSDIPISIEDKHKNKKSKSKEVASKVDAQQSKSPVNKGVRGEMATLRAELGDVDSIPLGKETLREFASRTTAYWSKEVIRVWREKQEERGIGGERVTVTTATTAVLSEKEIKREAFKLAEVRYNELLPQLSRLAVLEGQQQQGEEDSSVSTPGAGNSSSRSAAGRSRRA